MATDYRRLAKRISAVTTNCLLTGVVLVVGLGLGHQLLRWWREDPAGSAGASGPVEVGDGLSDPRRLHVVQFGEGSWSLRRQSVAGGRDAAATALRAVCREVLGRERLPGEAPGQAESELLGRLAGCDPTEQEPGGWRLYELGEAFPMVAGTQPRAGATGSSPGGDDAGPGHRVVVWGVALPAGPEAWTVLSFQPEVANGQPSVGLPEVAIPDGCRRTLSMRVAGGGVALAFEGPQEPDNWVDFYDRWFATYNWRRLGRWQQSGSGWHARYVAPGQEAAGRADVHLGSRGSGRGTGLLMVSVARSEDAY